MPAQKTIKASDSIVMSTALISQRHSAAPVSKETDSIAVEKNLNLGVDFASRYIWRGQPYGGRFFAIQPYIEYAFSDRISTEVWATSNFRKNIFKNEQYGLQGYQEYAFSLMYALSDIFTIRLDNYYAPVTNGVGDVYQYKNNFFYYGPDAAQTLDMSLTFDLSEKGLPLSGIVSTYVAGNDYRTDENDKNPTKNYTTYVELMYTFSNAKGDFTISPIAGLLLNNAAEAYVNADYDKPSFVNLRLDAVKTFALGNRLLLPVSLSYIHNASTANLEFSGRNFLQGTVSLYY